MKEKDQGSFQIDCICCSQPVIFSISDLKDSLATICCKECGKKYALGDTNLKRQLTLFGELCQQIRLSEEILGDAAIAVDVGPHSIKVPFKLLLTRLKSTLDLKVGETPITVSFRVQPTEKRHP